MVMDPLERLPAEIVLRILEFTEISSLARLTCLSKSWHRFIDHAHQNTVYLSKTSHPAGSHDLSFLSQSTSFTRYFDGTNSFKELCKRQTLLARNWRDEHPITRESVYQVGNDPIWRFRPDFSRRFFISTSQNGGLRVTDMDTGHVLWRLSSEYVRPYAHLEYQGGSAVWDCSTPRNGIEVWKTGLEGLSRGEFRKIAVLAHDCDIRGFQLSYGTLCVASTQGHGFTYNMNQDPPHLKTRLKIENDAVGHLDQNAEVVIYCMGKKGYHVHDKTSGALLGILEPKKCRTFYHIRHPDREQNSIVNTGNALSALPSVQVYPPKQPNRDRFFPIKVVEGPLVPVRNESANLEDDEWGAAVLVGPLMVAISRAGRVIICSDWKEALRNPKSFENNSAIIETEADESSFDIGGWLSVRDNRIMVEVQDHIYVVALSEDGKVRSPAYPSKQPSYSFSSSSATQLAVPVSFMALFDDCIMATYTTLGWRRPNDPSVQYPEPVRGIFPTKTVRVLSFAPELGTESDLAGNLLTPTDGNGGSHAAILELMDMLSDEDSSDSDDEPEGP